MKFQPTCSICLSKIKILDLRIGSRRGRKLLCKHVFHASCIDGIYKPQCPLCQHPIFNADEEALLTASPETAIHILKNIHKRNINVKSIFMFLTSSNSSKYQWIIDLMYKYCDFTELLADNLKNKLLVKEIVTKGKVNWFKTFCGGLTFFDLVYERTDDPEIIDMIHSKLPQSEQVIRPGNTLHTTPRASYQRHKRMDSMSGAALEQLAAPMERIATVRRSLRGRLYPLVIDAYEQEQQCETYPIYESLYPSAPPIDLM